MNKLKTIISICVFAFSLSGCYDLERHPFDQVGEETFWKNDIQVNQGMMGIYAALRTEHAFGKKFSFDALSDMGIGYDGAGYGPMVLGTYTPRTGLVESVWKALYDGVMRANLAIRKISDSEGIDDAAKNKYIAEAKFLRCVFYFQLYNLFGGIPLYDESVDQSVEYNTLMNPRSSAEETINFIVSDLTDVINGGNLPVHWDDINRGRATLGAAYALRGKVYLYARKYDKAESDFEEVILDPSARGYNYGLYVDYENLFRPGGDESEEMIFAIQNSGGVGTDFGMPMTHYLGSRSAFGSDWNNVMPSVALVDEYELKDGHKFDWEDFIPGYTTDEAVRTATYVSTWADEGKTIGAYPPNVNTLRNMYDQRDPRMMITILLPYTWFEGWVQNASKMCEFVVAYQPAPNEANGFIRMNGIYTESYAFRKFVATGNMNGAINDRAHTPINFPLIRLADVYLMYAECMNELGDPLTAVDYINKVRRRPSVDMPEINNGDPWMSAMTRDEIFDRIRHERAVELACEGHRWDDLRRWGEALARIPGEAYGFTGRRLMTKVFTEKDMLWPIPGAEIDINPNLEQNPGW